MLPLYAGQFLRLFCMVVDPMPDAIYIINASLSFAPASSNYRWDFSAISASCWWLVHWRNLVYHDISFVWSFSSVYCFSQHFTLCCHLADLVLNSPGFFHGSSFGTCQTSSAFFSLVYRLWILELRWEISGFHIRNFDSFFNHLIMPVASAREYMFMAGILFFLNSPM